MTRTTALFAAGLLAAAGLAATASAQHSTTSITSNDGQVQGYTIKAVGGVKYKVEFDQNGPNAAYVDGLEVDFEFEDGAVLIIDGDKVVTYDFARLMDGAEEVSTSGFADALIANL